MAAVTTDGTAVVVVKDEEELLVAEPMPGLHDTTVPPFLTKTFEMVEDMETDGIVSWSMERNSFVVWDPYRLSSDLLPRYFKHDNFASFIRQLNTYGFRKVFPDRWEFAHEKFLGGQKHLLKDIKRRRNVSQQKVEAEGSIELGPGTGSCEQFGIETDVDRLKRDRSILAAEIATLKQQQQSSRTQILATKERIQHTERTHQRTAAFLARAIKNPVFIEQLLLQSEQKKQQLDSPGWKRRLTATARSENVEPDGVDFGATAGSENVEPDGVDFGADMVKLLSTTGKDGGNSGRDQHVEAVLQSGDQDFGVISDVFLEEFLDVGLGQRYQAESELEVEDLAGYPCDGKEMVEELIYLGSEPWSMFGRRNNE